MQPSPKPYGQRRSRVIKVACLSAQSIDSTFLQGRPQNGPDAVAFWTRCSFPWASLPVARGRASFMTSCPRQDLIDLVCLHSRFSFSPRLALSFAVREGLTMEPPTSGGEVVARGQGVGVIGAQHPLPVGQGALEQYYRLVQPPRRRVGGGEVVARVHGVGVVDIQQSLTV